MVVTCKDESTTRDRYDINSPTILLARKANFMILLNHEARLHSTSRFRLSD